MSSQQRAGIYYYPEAHGSERVESTPHLCANGSSGGKADRRNAYAVGMEKQIARLRALALVLSPNK